MPYSHPEPGISSGQRVRETHMQILDGSVGIGKNVWFDVRCSIHSDSPSHVIVIVIQRA